jgi:hypothetical protein
MGSYSSGNHGGKSCTTDMQSLDVRMMQRDGQLNPGTAVTWTWSRGGKRSGAIDVEVHRRDMVMLKYTTQPQGQDKQNMSYEVQLDWTPCHYGGERAWWLCPSVGCGRRVAVIYGGSVFACRHCQKLAYKCQRETPGDRNLRAAEKIRERLGWQRGILNPAGGKPKGMQWRTYLALQAQHDAHVRKSLAAMWVTLGKSHTRMVALNAKMDLME